MNINKRTSKPRKVKSGKRVAIIFNVIEWSLYIVFSVLAALFMRDVWDQFQAKETFMAQSLKPITKLPSLTLCLEPKKTWSYIEEIIKIRVTINGKSYKTLKENETLYRIDGVGIKLHQINYHCFRVKFTPGSEFDASLIQYVKVDFSKNEPTSIKATFVSEENSYGYYQNEWFDGKVFRRTILPGYRVNVVLWQNRYTYLQTDNQCSDKTFVKQLMPHLVRANFSQAPKKCSDHFMFASVKLPLCGWGGGQNLTFRNGAKTVIYGSYRKFIKEIGRKRPCHTMDYSGEILNNYEKYSEQTFVIELTLPELTTHYTEHLVFDLVGMVGSVGGTLGMCIGFSFSGITSTLLGFIKSKFDSYF